MDYEPLHPISEMETDSEESFDEDMLFPQINMSGPNNQNIAVWSYLKHEAITLFSPSSGDTMVRVIRYCEKYLNYSQDNHKLMMLSPCFLTPIDLQGVYSVKPGSVIMMLPQTTCLLKVEIAQLKASLSISVDIMNTVFRIKSLIKKIKGLPIERQEILFRDQSLDNNRRLLEYRIAPKSVLHVMIQPHFDLVINVETFWGKSYRFYIDPCSTGTDLIYMVFNRTFSRGGPEDAGIHELYVPFHLLILKYKSRFVACDFCLAYLYMKSGETLSLTTVGIENQLEVRKLKCVTEKGKIFNMNVSRHDRWSLVAFLLHGLTDVPVDLIRIYRDKHKLDLSSIIGDFPQNSSVMMNVVVTKMDSDLIFGIPLCIVIGNGIIENVRIAPHKTVKNVKKKLQRFGVPYATAYELVYNNEKLRNNLTVKDIVADFKSPLLLQLERFPVFVHAPDGVIYKTFIKASESIGAFKKKMEQKSAIPMDCCRLMLAGEEIMEEDFHSLYDAGVSMKSSIFIRPPNEIQNMYIKSSNSLVKLHIPMEPSTNEIRNSIWSAKRLPESSITCVLTFLYWFFTPRFSGSNYINVRQLINQRMPVARQPLHHKDPDKKSQEKVRDNKHKAHFLTTFRPDSRQSWSSSKSISYIPPKGFDPKGVVILNGHKISMEKDAESLEKENHLSFNHKNPPWVKELHARNKENRLVLSDLDAGPDFLMHTTRTKKSPRKHNTDRPKQKVPDTLSTYSLDDMALNHHGHKRVVIKPKHRQKDPWKNYYKKVADIDSTESDVSSDIESDSYQNLNLI